jgi:hypothetical protein
LAKIGFVFAQRLHATLTALIPLVALAGVSALSVALLPAIGSLTIARAATVEEVQHCRAIQINKQRLDCFKSLKEKGISKATKENIPKTTGGAPPMVRDAHEQAPSDSTSTSSIDRSAALSLPVCVDRDALGAMLLAGVLASNREDATTNGCQTIPKDAKTEILERYPTAFDLLLVVKVRVTFPTPPDNSTVGYTVEIGR